MAEAHFPESAIPEQLLSRLRDLRETLCTGGTVLVRTEKDRKRAYRLRVRVMDNDKGYRRQLSIAVGDNFKAGAVNVLLQEWRVMHLEHAAAEAAEAARQGATDQQEKKEVREDRALAQELGGGGRRRRQKIGKLYEEAVAAGGLSEWAFWVGHEYEKPNARPGRRRKSGLTVSGNNEAK